MRINKERNSIDMETRDINYILPPYVRNYLFYNRNEMPERIIFPMFPSVNVDGKDIPIEYIPPTDPVAVEIAEDGKSVAEVTPAQEAALDEKDDRIKILEEEVKRLTEGGPETPLPEEELAILAKEAEEETHIDSMGEQVSPARAAFAKSGDVLGQTHREEIKMEGHTAEEEKPVAFKIDPDPAHQPPPDRIPHQPASGDLGPGVGPSDMHSRDRRDQDRTAKDLVEGPEIDEEKEKEYEKKISRDEQGRPIVEDKGS